MNKIAAIKRMADRDSRSAIVALHCSGHSGRQWRHLAEVVGNRHTFVAPDLFGAGATGPWSGAGPFRLVDEAAAVVAIIDELRMPVHLAGHSYGAGVALRAALKRPNRVASLLLYEPTAFHVLRSMGSEGRAALAEIRSVAGAIDRAVLSGAYRAAAERFVDYWNGKGTWASIRPKAQAELAGYAPKMCLDFRALIEEQMPLVAYRRLRIPLLLMRGEHAPEPTRLIARKLAEVMRPRVVTVMNGAGHMGPLTHADDVNRAIAGHVAAIDARRQRDDAWMPQLPLAA